MIERLQALARLDQAFRIHPAVVVLGPRQCGKTTLARGFAQEKPGAYFDLENPVDLQRLQAPMLALDPLRGLVVIDEAQRLPELWPVLRVLCDRLDNPACFLLLGSASPELVRGASESLAGRLGFLDLSGFTLEEVGAERLFDRWLRGGFPRSFLAPDDRASIDWRDAFIRTFLERDLAQLGVALPPETMRRLWTMVAHYHGRIWNAAQFARSLGVTEPTVRRYLDVLAGTHMVRVLQPWYVNLRKRQVKAPKVYLRDSGLLHAFLGLRTMADLQGHPMVGASWEGLVLEQLFALTRSRDLFFWATHGGAELDMVLTVNGKTYGVECKYADAPGTTRSMHVAIADLGLEHLFVVYPGSQEYRLAETITALPLHGLTRVLQAA